MTLLYQNKKFCELPWTYPDFKTGAYIDFFTRLLNVYRRERKEALGDAKNA